MTQDAITEGSITIKNAVLCTINYYGIPIAFRCNTQLHYFMITQILSSVGFKWNSGRELSDYNPINKNHKGPEDLWVFMCCVEDKLGLSSAYGNNTKAKEFANNLSISRATNTMKSRLINSLTYFPQIMSGSTTNTDEIRRLITSELPPAYEQPKESNQCKLICFSSSGYYFANTSGKEPFPAGFIKLLFQQRLAIKLGQFKPEPGLNLYPSLNRLSLDLDAKIESDFFIHNQKRNTHDKAKNSPRSNDHEQRAGRQRRTPLETGRRGDRLKTQHRTCEKRSLDLREESGRKVEGLHPRRRTARRIGLGK